jgi:K+-transporting ATPase ATPase C chain
MKHILIAVKMLVVMTLLTGVVYTGLVTVIAQSFFGQKANGSLLKKDETIVGSKLIQQKFTQEKYFWGRPSASDFGTLPSGGSNLGPTSEALKKQVSERLLAIEVAHPAQKGHEVPGDLLFASGSGIDPHISVAAAEYQVERVAKGRGMAVDDLRNLIHRKSEPRPWGFLGEPVINVLVLNMELDR